MIGLAFFLEALAYRAKKTQNNLFQVLGIVHLYILNSIEDIGKYNVTIFVILCSKSWSSGPGCQS